MLARSMKSSMPTGAEVLAGAKPDCDSVGLDFLVADDEHVRHLQVLRLAILFCIRSPPVSTSARMPASRSARRPVQRTSTWRSAMGMTTAWTGARPGTLR